MRGWPPRVAGSTLCPPDRREGGQRKCPTGPAASTPGPGQVVSHPVKELAPGVWQLSGFPPNGINVFLLEDVLVDAASRHAGRRILRQLAGRKVTAHALTHAHPDHQGASKEICEELSIPFWVGERDADAAENPDLIRQRQPDHPVGRASTKHLRRAGPPCGPHPAARVTRWRGSRCSTCPDTRPATCPTGASRTACSCSGDVLNNMDVITAVPGLHEPKPFLTPDPAENRRSIRKLAALEPALVLFGHGAPLRDTDKLRRFVAELPA